MKRSLGDRFRYRFDNVMARGTGALIGLLGLVSLVLIVIVTGLVWVFRAFPDDAPQGDLADIFWGSLLRTLDPGTMASDAGWGFRIFMLVVTIGGIVFVAALIGIVSGAFDAKVEDLRKGRSRVLENDHTLILGWNSTIPLIIHELAIANQSRGRASIVILAPRDKVEMDDAVHAIAGLGRTKVICRTGDPKRPADLAIVSPNEARSIVVLAPEGSPNADAEVIKTVLALVQGSGRKASPYNVVAELDDPANLDAARLVGRDEAQWIVGPELIARIAVQTCRQSGMSVIYSELLDFEGDEIYFTTQPTLVGRSYADAQAAFPKCAAMGLVRNGRIELNPASETVIGDDDQVIVIAQDDSTIKLGAALDASVDDVAEVERARQRPERILVLCSNPSLPLILSELDDEVAARSTVRIVTDAPVPNLPTLTHVDLSLEHANPARRAVLESLDVTTFEHVLVLADATAEDPQRADSRTLVTLLQLRDLLAGPDPEAGADEPPRRALSGSGEASPVPATSVNVVSEMLDDGNRELAEVTQADDFIVSRRLIALLLAQVSENQHVTEVFRKLLSSAGPGIYLNRASDYIKPGRTVSFYTVLEAARRRGETAIGYRVAAYAHNSAEHYGVRLNPQKDDPITFAPGDRVIVVAAGAN